MAVVDAPVESQPNIPEPLYVGRDAPPPPVPRRKGQSEYNPRVPSKHLSPDQEGKYTCQNTNVRGY
jgi:hypothetical protein